MKKREKTTKKTGRTNADLLEDYIIKPILSILRAITQGRVAKYHSLLSTLRFMSMVMGGYMVIIPTAKFIYEFLRAFNMTLIYEIHFSDYLFCLPKIQFVIGVVLLAFAHWYNKTLAAVSREPEIERTFKERTTLQRQLLLSLDEDDDIIEGTDEKQK